MTDAHERRIDRQELRLILFQCRHCKGEITFDAANPQRENLGGPTPAL